jgi:hypothetical protein
MFVRNGIKARVNKEKYVYFLLSKEVDDRGKFAFNETVDIVSSNSKRRRGEMSDYRKGVKRDLTKGDVREEKRFTRRL